MIRKDSGQAAMAVNILHLKDDSNIILAPLWIWCPDDLNMILTVLPINLNGEDL
jgi:hypothetical protein